MWLWPRRDTLWILVVSPTIWAVHLLIGYPFAAIWCAKVVGRDGSLWGARIAILVLTAIALAGIGTVGLWGLRAHRSGRGPMPHEADTPEARHRLLGLATLLLSSLSAVAVLYEAMVIAFVETCR